MVARVVRPQRIVFAEGKTDAAALFLASGLPGNTDFRTADEIDHEPDTNEFVGGNKARVCDLIGALRLFNDGQAKEKKIENLRGLIDSDFSYIDGEQHCETDKYLIATEFANLNAGAVLYLLIRDCVFSGHGYLITEDLWKDAIVALKFCFGGRYHNAKARLGQKAPKAGSYLEREGDRAGFRKGAYLQAYFGVQGVASDDLQETISGYYDPETDCRHFINSGDFFSVLYQLIRPFHGGGGGFSEANVRSTLLASMAAPACDQAGAREIVEWSAAA